MSDLSTASNPARDTLTPRQGRKLWYGDDLRGEQGRWLHHFTDADLDELDEAIQRYAAGGQDLVAMTRADFELPGLARTLDLDGVFSMRPPGGDRRFAGHDAAGNAKRSG